MKILKPYQEPDRYRGDSSNATIWVLCLSIAFLIGAVVLASLCGCNPQPTPDPTPAPDAADRTRWSPLVAVAAAEAAMHDGSTPAPDPAPDPDPDDDDGSGAKPAGPLDFYRDAKALVAKGNALADRGKAILDRAEAEGKVTIDVKLPGADKAEKPSGNAQAPPAQSPAGSDTGESTAGENEQRDCSDGSCQARGPLRRSFRRRR